MVRIAAVAVGIWALAGMMATGASTMRAGAESGMAYSVEAREDAALSTEPGDAFWREAKPIVADGDPWGKPVPGHRTTIYSRWTEKNLYFLFVCPYEELNLKPDPVTGEETNELWKWDVAEVFIGWDFANIKRYKEFEISPQSEWVDLDIDREHPLPEGGWRWNSGFQVAARIDREKKVWYGAMKIPMAAIAGGAVKAGTRFRVNFYRSQGAGEQNRKIAWQAVMNANFHTPERFGILELAEEKP